MKKESGVDLDVTWEPFELHPETPADGILVTEFFGGKDPETIFSQLRERGAALGRHFEAPERLFNTRRALMLAEFARDEGSLEAVHRELFAAYFARGEDISDEGVLRHIAGEAGLDPDRAWKAVEEGRYTERLDEARLRAEQERISGTPAFILAEKYLVSGAQPYDAMESAVQRAAKEMGEPVRGEG